MAVDKLQYLQFINENQCSSMPYFTKWLLPDGRSRIGFKCLLCNHYYYNRLTIMKHVAQHFYFVCHICDNRRFAVASNFKYHFRANHYVNSQKMKCKDCDSEIGDIDLYVKHVPCNFKYSCDVCPFKTKVENSLIGHVKNEHKKERNNCVDCGSFFLDEESLRKHVLGIRDNKFVCDSCDMVFHTKEFLDAHYQIHGMNHRPDNSKRNEADLDGSCEASTSGSKTFVMNKTPSTDPELLKRIAPLYGNRRDNNEAMMRFFQDIVDKKITGDRLPLEKILGTGTTKLGFKCPFCKKGFDPNNEKTLIWHAQNHLLLTCFRCKRIFDRRESFSVHFKEHTREFHVFNCIVCKNISQFDNLTKYVTHVHHHMQKRICEICQEIFPSSRKLEYHIKKMHKQIFNEKMNKLVKILCDHCGEQFKKMYDLKLHINRKQSNLPGNKKVCSDCGKQVSVNKFSEHNCTDGFICAYCSKVFDYKPSLISHIFVHMNEQKFKCNLCEKRFNRDSSLNKHKKDMHSWRKWRCNVVNCNSSYSFKSALVKHMKSAHC